MHRRRLSHLALGLFAALVVIGSFAVFAQPMLRELVTRQAADRGIELSAGRVSVHARGIDLLDVHFRLLGVLGLEGTAPRVHVDLAWLTPRAIAISQAHVEVVNAWPSLLRGLSRWSAHYPSISQLPLTMRESSVKALDPVSPWSRAYSKAGRPWLVVEDFEMAPAPASGSAWAHASRLIAWDRPHGSLDARWHRADGGLVGSLTLDGLPTAKLTFEIAGTPVTQLVVASSPFPLPELNGPWGMALPEAAVESARVRFDWAKEDDPDSTALLPPRRELSRKTQLDASSGDPAIAKALGEPAFTGSISVRLRGWVPPHPRELERLALGDETTLVSSFAVSDDGQSIKLDPIALDAGALKMTGFGAARIRGHTWDATSMHLRLRQELPCSTLMAGNLGSVDALLTIDGPDLRDVLCVIPTIRPGCGLVPLPIPDSWQPMNVIR